MSVRFQLKNLLSNLPGCQSSDDRQLLIDDLGFRKLQSKIVLDQTAEKFVDSLLTALSQQADDLDQFLTTLEEQSEKHLGGVDRQRVLQRLQQAIKVFTPEQWEDEFGRTKQKKDQRLALENTIPSYPPHYLQRINDLERINKAVQEVKATVIISTQQSIGIPSTQRSVALQGMGGVGKSVLAAAFARREETLHTFTDGIVWLTVGQQTEPLPLLQEAGRLFGDEEHLDQYLDAGAAQKRLGELLKDAAYLIVLDDVWTARQVEPILNLLEVQTKCHLLITTREGSLVTNLGAKEIQINVLSNEEALTLLAKWVEKDVDSLPLEAHTVARACGNLPFALALCGAMVRDGLSWEDLVKALKEAGVEFLARDDTFPNYPYENVSKVIQVSLRFLKEQESKCYYELAVFREDAVVPEAAVQTFWFHINGLKDYQASRLMTVLERKSLLRLEGNAPVRRVTMHDLLHDNLQRVVKDKTRLHGELVEAYRVKCSDGWYNGPKDGYFFQKLAYHLQQAQRRDELRALLTDFRWLRTKLDATNVIALLEDYDLLPEDMDLQVVKEAILLSAHVLADDRQQLATQLLGRLQSHDTPAIQTLLQGARQYGPGEAIPWFRPLAPTLNQAGGPLQRVFFGHEGSVKAVAMTSVWKWVEGKHTEEKWVVSASEDKTLKVWDWKTGELKYTLFGHTDAVWAVAVTPNGKRAVSGSQDTTLKVWDLEHGTELYTFPGHRKWVHAVAVDPDGEWVISGSEAGDLIVWRLEDGTVIRTLPGHPEEQYINAVTVTPDGKRAISASRDSTLKVWDLASGKELHLLKGHTESVLAVAVTPDGKQVISASRDKTLKVWDLASGKELRTLEGHAESVRAVAVTPDGKHVVSASRDTTIKVWDLESGKMVRTINADSGPITAIAVVDDGRKVISAPENQTVKIWDLERDTGRSTHAGSKRSILALAATADGRVVSASQDKMLTVWNLTNARVLRAFPSLHEKKWVYALVVMANGRVISTSWDKTLKVWNLESGGLLHTFEGHRAAVKAVAVTPDGQQMISGSRDTTLKVWDMKSGKEIFTLVGHQASIEGVTVTADQRAISASCDRTLKVWDLKKCELELTLVGHEAAVNAVAVTTDGRYAVSASCDRTLKVWDLQSGELVRTLVDHTSWVHAVAVTPDGQYVVSASDDNRLKLWSLHDGRCIATFTGDGALSTCALAPDEVTVVAGEKWGRMHFLRLENI